jgi:hypothetical protein
MGMTIKRLGWVVFGPLMLASWLVSHCVAYRLVGAGDTHPMLEDGMLEEGAHGYMPAPALVLAAALALALVGFAAAVVVSARGARWSRVSLTAAVALPAFGFTVQEHLEHALSTGSFPATAVLEPTFAVGLLLQLPLVAAAAALACGLLATAKRLGRDLRGSWLRLPAPAPASSTCMPRASLAPRNSPLASRHMPRAPPVLLVR